MSESRFNAVAILDAIPLGESNTARRLKEELTDIANYTSLGLQILYARIETINDLEQALGDLLNKKQLEGLDPLLHLEGHGLVDRSGFVVANGTPCSWHKLNELITPLNVAMRLNLMLVLGTCFGGSFASAINTTDRAPVGGLIGPKMEVTAGQIETSFQVFYKTFFNTLSTSKSLKTLNDSAPPATYLITGAKRFFYEVWKSYKTNLCSEEMIEKRATRMRHKAIYDKVLSNLPIDIPSIEQFKQLINNKTEEKHLFEKYRDVYFMVDLYPSHQQRFRVSYKEAEKYIAN